MEYQDIFAEYFSQFRGQAVQIPVFGDREFTVAIYRCNSAIRKWDRTDGVLWNELITTAQEQATLPTWADADRVIADGTLTYTPPNNMRKPPSKVRLFTSATNYTDINVTKAEKALDVSDSNIIWFSGGANTGYTMHVGSMIAQQYNGWGIDYKYIKKPTLLTVDSDPSATVIDMSDPGYAIQDMLATAFAAAKNGFGYKVAAKEKSIAIINMKIENSSGTLGDTHGLDLDSGWGVNTPINDIRL